MLNVKQNLVSKEKYNIKCPYEMIAEFIAVHNTANDAPAENEIKYMINNNNQVSFHLAVDDKEVVQGLPLDRNGWHCGDGKNGTGNRKSIGIEICYSKSGGDKFIKAEQNAAELIAQLLKEKGWGIDRVKKHQDFSNKYCPHRTLDMGWDRFLDMVKAHLEVTIPQKTPNQNEYLIKVTTNALNIREGAGTNYKIVGVIRDKGTYTIVETQNNWGKLKSGAGWICLDYTDKITTKKSNEEIADEIINEPNFGGWGKGKERQQKLKEAGYNPNEIQNIINEKLK